MPVTRRLTVTALVALLAAGIVCVAWAFPTDAPNLAFDLRVYLGAVQAMLSGTPGGLYGFALPDIAGPAPFLYPPFAAVLMIPAAHASFGSIATAWLVVRIGLFLLVMWVVLRCSGRLSSDGHGRLLAGACALLLVALRRSCPGSYWVRSVWRSRQWSSPMCSFSLRGDAG